MMITKKREDTMKIQKRSYLQSIPTKIPNTYISLIISLILILHTSYISLSAYEPIGRSFYTARSQSLNAARDLVGFCQFLNSPHCGFEGMLVATPEYQRSFRSPRIAEYFFNTDTIRVTGSQVPNRCEFDLMADNFGLSPSFDSTVVMKPRIESAFVNFEMYLSYNPWYMRIYAPACWSRWNYRLEECIQDNGDTTPFPENYMAQSEVQEPVTSFKEAICGNRSWGDVQTGLVENILCGPASTKGLADLRMFFGWHILRNERYYVGLNLIAAAPTGNRSTSKLFFEPMVGNGKHWEVGAGLEGRVLAWEADGKHELSLYGVVHATHMCRSNQRRSFDFCRNGFASRYLLLKEFDGTGNYNGNLVPASTITTLPCRVWMAGQFDIVAMLGYSSCGLEIDFGYNAWIRTREHVTICGTIEEKRYGIKGIQNVIDAFGNYDNKTQSSATIFGNELTPEEQARTADPNSPVFIRTDDLNPCSAAATSAFTNKLFAHVGYTWSRCKHADPYLGIGGEVEFEGLSPELDRRANNNSVAQWGIWLKGGALFM